MTRRDTPSDVCNFPINSDIAAASPDSSDNSERIRHDSIFPDFE